MKILKSCFIICIALLFTQCEQENELLDFQDVNNVDEATKEKIAKLGFDVENYPVLKDGEYFTVEGDINIPASYLENTKDDVQAKQRRFVNIVSCQEIKFITVFNNLPPGSPRNAVSVAMRHWNEITNCDIRFEFTNNINSAEVIISKGPLNQGTVGRGTLPSNGKPGKYIRLDLDQFSNYDFAQWRTVIGHELGHNIGFAHANGTGSDGPIPGVEIWVAGTPLLDSSSIMFSRIGGNNRKPNIEDIKAARFLYNPNDSNRLCKSF
ncbi:M57 family metalloprotease [uncultured Aquimarina sp.]|uniref:M57 family metalloprotease n=1 Tax=uncultured Aquimarina sp. TaxID=575652 RepID=UPI00262D08EC|nr:M57 family metalloprotease [uncultured Aquimarina sp.]